MIQNYEKEQKDRIQRKRNSIWAARILEINGNDLVIRSDFKFDKTIKIPVSHPEDYNIGMYIDVIVWKSGTSSYGARFLGATPEEFIPEDGVDLGAV